MELERMDIDLTDKNFEFSNSTDGSDNAKEFSNAEGKVDPKLVAGAITSAAGVATSLIGNKSELEQQIKARCGRKPWFNGKGQKDEWRDCRENFITTQQELERARIAAMNQQGGNTQQGKGGYQQPEYRPDQDKKGVSTLAVVGIALGVVAVGLTTYLIAKKK